MLHLQADVSWNVRPPQWLWWRFLGKTVIVNVQGGQCSRRASEKKAIMYYTKFTLPTVEGRPSLQLLWRTRLHFVK